MFRIGWDIVVAVANIELTVGNSDDTHIQEVAEIVIFDINHS